MRSSLFKGSGLVRRYVSLPLVVPSTGCKGTSQLSVSSSLLLPVQHKQQQQQTTVTFSTVATTSTTKSTKTPITTTGSNNNNNNNGIIGGIEIKKLKEIHPHMDVVKYTHKNYVMSLSRIDYYAEAVAIGLLETGLTQGDIVLSWLPNHFQEQMILQFACSKAGLILYTLDPMIATTDPDSSMKALKSALELTKANVFISQEAGDDVNYIRLAERVIPELRIFDYATGEPFITPRFPHLRFCINTGFDYEDKWGWLLIKHMVIPAGNLVDFVKPGYIKSTTPLAGGFIYDDDNKIPIKLGKTLTNDEVVSKNIWPTYCKILKKDFHVVEGVGVIF